MWKNLSVRNKLIVCILPLVLLIMFSTYFSNRTLSLIDRIQVRIENATILQANFEQRKVDHLKWVQSLLAHVAEGETTPLPVQVDPMQCTFGKWYYSQERTNTQNLVPDLVPIFKSIEKPHTDLHKSSLKINSALAAGEHKLLLDIIENETMPALTSLLAQLDTTDKVLITRVKAINDYGNEARQEATMVNAVSMVAGVILALICAFVLLRSIMVPLRNISKYARACAANDGSSKNIDRLTRTDEFGQVANALYKLMDNLDAQISFSKSVLNGFPVATAVYTVDNKLEFCNQLMLHLLGHKGKPEDYYGQSSGKFLFNDQNRETASVLAIRNKEARQLTVEFESPTGRYHMLTQAVPLFTLNGELRGALSVWDDITPMALKQAEVEKARNSMLNVAAKAQRVAESVSELSESLAVKIHQASGGAATQRDKVQASANAMNEINSSVQEVTNNSAKISELSKAATGKAQQGEVLVQDMIKATHELTAQAKKTMHEINGLADKANNVGSVVTVISDIADQTNLLALNAAIEAARAGDLGRGFAVVADEVRKLAEKSMLATQEVMHAIHGIQDEAKRNVEAVGKSTEAIGRTSEMAIASGDALSEIVTLSEQVNGEIGRIAAASCQQSKASNSVSDALSNVSNLAFDTAAIMEQAAQNTQALATEAHTLSDLVQELK